MIGVYDLRLEILSLAPIRAADSRAAKRIGAEGRLYLARQLLEARFSDSRHNGDKFVSPHAIDRFRVAKRAYGLGAAYQQPVARRVGTMVVDLLQAV